MGATKIELSENELNAIRDYVDGKVDFVGCDEEQQIIYSAILDKVDYYETELDAFDERMETPASDGILWLYNRYLKQEGKEPVSMKNSKFL